MKLNNKDAKKVFFSKVKELIKFDFISFGKNFNNYLLNFLVLLFS